MHQSIDKKNKYLFYFIIFLFLTTINSISLTESKDLLSKVKTVEVSGLKENLNLEMQRLPQRLMVAMKIYPI